MRLTQILFFLLTGALLTSCADQKPLTALQEQYFHVCQEGGDAAAERWAGGSTGNISGAEKAVRLYRIKRNVEKKCECEARGFAEILTVDEYRQAIKWAEAWASAHAGRPGNDEAVSEAVSWLRDLSAAKMEGLVAIEDRCPSLLGGVGPG